jgi:hypothetical protein
VRLLIVTFWLYLVELSSKAVWTIVVLDELWQECSVPVHHTGSIYYSLENFTLNRVSYEEVVFGTFLVLSTTLKITQYYVAW